MSKIVAMWVSLSAGLLVYGFVSLPTWLFASMNRSTLWCLRDHVFDARRKGHLPNAPEVEGFIRSLERLIVVLPSVSALQIWWFGRFHLGALPKRGELPFFQKLTHESPATQRYFALLQDELGRIVLRQYLLGSWSSILFVVPRRRRDLRAVLRRHHDFADWSKAVMDTRQQGEHWRNHQVVAEVERVVPHIRKRRETDLIAASG